MEDHKILIEPLIERVEQYGKTSIELLKLKSLNKTSDILSTLLSRLFLIIVILLFALTLNTAIAFWLGELLGKNYYGFLVVAAFYGLVGMLLLIIHPSIKSKINDSIITQMFN